RSDVYKVLDGERDYQEKMWGDTGLRRTNLDTTQNSKHDVGEWMIFMQHYMNNAVMQLTLQHGPEAALHQLRKV
ncbi:MAG: hypothetical protein KGI50_05680, partial [Patescibacteria group bacterium]|nr:hypothetical protein [Patescibacteria group bacterium]